VLDALGWNNSQGKIDEVPPRDLKTDGKRVAMPLLLLLLLIVACLPVRWPPPPDWLDVDVALALTWLGVAGMIGLASGVAYRFRWILARDPGQHAECLQRYATWRLYHALGLFAFYGLSLYLLGWGWCVQNVYVWGPPGPDGYADTLPGVELLVLAPFLTALLLSWACFYDAERALHDALTGPDDSRAYWGRGAYVLFHIRQHLALVFAPVLLLLLLVVNGLPHFLPSEMASLIRPVAGLAVIAVLPWLVRIVLGLRPMPEGLLRTRLLNAARRLHFRCNDILIWNTRRAVANAMVVGILPVLRYVVFTDRLVSEMTPDEVEAVFGHEAGHIKHHHIPCYLGFLIGSVALVATLWNMVGASSLFSWTKQETVALLPFVGLLGAYMVVVFGFLSRRCEWQADLYGCRTVSCARSDCTDHEPEPPLVPGGQGLCATGIRTFISALEKVAALNGISRDRPGWLQSWQHSTIARRVEFLERVLVDRAVASRFQRRVALVKWGLFLALGLFLILAAQVWGWKNIELF
jgi:STE24 endopeptidase